MSIRLHNIYSEIVWGLSPESSRRSTAVFPHITGSDRRRFAAKVGAPDARGCTLWTASALRNGYGQFVLMKCGGGTKRERTLHVYAHRMAWVLANGRDIPESHLLVLHACDVPLCVNPSHLFLGDQLDNMRDASRKGRLRRKAVA